MHRRAFLVSLAGSLLAEVRTAPAQQVSQAYRIGLLDYATPNASGESRWQVLRSQLRELGYVDGETIVFEPRSGHGHIDRLPGLARDLVNRKVAIVVTATTEAALAVKQATRTIPIVMATSADPVALGVVASLARPGGNVTGVISLSRDLVGKRVELLKEVVPRATRIAIVRDPDSRSSALTASEAEKAARPLGMTVQYADVKPGAYDAAFSAMKRAHAEAVILSGNTLFIADRRRLAELALAHRLPLMAPAREYAEAGGLLSYGADYPDMFRHAALYVDKILKGAKPGDLPVEQPTKFELVINLKTAKTLGLTIPSSVLARPIG